MKNVLYLQTIFSCANKCVAYGLIVVKRINKNKINMTEITARERRANESQKEFLVNFLEKNLDIANNKFRTPQAVKYRNDVWKELKNNFNALDGPKKNTARWRRYWADLKLHTCKKYNAIIKGKQNNTYRGGKQLTSLEKKVLKIALQTSNKAKHTPVDNIRHEEMLVEDNNEETKTQMEEYFVNNECETQNNSISLTGDNISEQTLTTTAVLTKQRNFKRKKVSVKAEYLGKLLKTEENILKEMKEANSLKRKQNAILQEQTELMKANVRAKEIIALKLQYLINILSKKKVMYFQ